MIFKDEYNNSLRQKLLFVVAISATLVMASFLMWAPCPHGACRWEPLLIRGDVGRRILLSVLAVAYVARLLLSVFVFVRRKLVWTEAIVISFLMPVGLWAFMYTGGVQREPLGVLDAVSVTMYVLGSYLNTASEYSRHLWKQQPQNKGRVYTAGLFRYAMHINYFGDVLLFSGFALATHRLVMLVIPLLMALNFIVFIIPRLDAYLLDKYGQEFREYSNRTKKLIPGLY